MTSWPLSLAGAGIILFLCCTWKVYAFQATNLCLQLQAQFVPERCTFSKLRICVCNCKHSLSLKGIRFQSCESVCPWKVYVFKATNLCFQLQAQFVLKRCTVSKLRMCLSLKGLRFQSCESVFASASMHSLSRKKCTFSKLRIRVDNCKHASLQRQIHFFKG